MANGLAVSTCIANSASNFTDLSVKNGIVLLNTEHGIGVYIYGFVRNCQQNGRTHQCRVEFSGNAPAHGERASSA